jgi:ribosomal protein L32E
MIERCVEVKRGFQRFQQERRERVREQFRRPRKK